MRSRNSSLYTLFGCLLVTVTVSSWRIQPRIFGGKAAEVGQFPYVVSFRSTSIEGNFHDCGGAILSDRFVLLAAHCIKSNHREPAGYVVSVGAHNQYDGQIYSVKNIYVHNYFLASNLRNDIALIEVHDTIQFSEKVQPIQPGREFIGSGVEAIIAGFGRSNDDIKDLKFLHVKTMSYDECKTAFANSSIKPSSMHGDNTLCAYSGQYGHGICQGDSGGPLVFNNQVIGISSWGHKLNCAIGYPDGFTRVSEYLDWIEGVMTLGSNYIY